MGLWEDGKRIEWFNPDTVEKINKNEFDYSVYYKKSSSRGLNWEK